MKKTILILTMTLILVAGLLADGQKVVRITSDKANIRQKAATDSPIVATVSKDTLLPLLGKSGNWLRVQTADGKASGYVHSSLAQVEDAPDGFQVRSAEATAAEEPTVEKKARHQEKKVKPTVQTPGFRKESSFKKMYLAGYYAMSQLQEDALVGFTTTIYYETAEFDSAYQADKGSGFALAFGYRFSEALAVEIGADISSRDLATTCTYVVPHPLWVGVTRSGEISNSGKLTENTAFLNLAYTLKLKPLTVQLSAGPCMVMAEADLIENFEYGEASYPYATVSVSPVMFKEKQNVFGFNAGLGVGYSFSDSLTLMVNARYISAKMTLDGDGQDLTYPAELKLGGLKFGAGIQFNF